MSELSISTSSSGVNATTAGNSSTDTATLVVPSGGGAPTITFNTSAPGGGVPIALSSTGTGNYGGFNANEYSGSFGASGTTYSVNLNDVGVANGLSYSTFGDWTTYNGSNNLVGFGVYSVGSQTPLSSMPTTGTATYSGGAIGAVVVNSSGTSYGLSSSSVTLNANFGANSITGTIANISAYSVSNAGTAPVGTMNDINLTGGTISGNSFTGSAAASSTPGTAVNITGATGSFLGSFYGPAAQEAGGTFNLSSGSGASSTLITGAFGAHTP